MRLFPNQLHNYLQQHELAPLFLLYGNEPLQTMECIDAIRAKGVNTGYTEYKVLEVSGGFDWHQLTQSRDSLSLFATRRMIELRLGKHKITKAGSDALTHFASHPPDDTCLVITADKLTTTTQQAVWFKSCDKVGVHIPIKPPLAHELPQWIQQRLKTKGLQASPDAIKTLAYQTEGHLLATAQCIEKLSLNARHKPVIETEEVLSCTRDNAHFSIYDFIDTALSGDIHRTIRIFESLRNEGVEPILILWVITREMRQLLSMIQQYQKGEPLSFVLQKHAIWSKRHQCFSAAIKRLTPTHIRHILLSVRTADNQIKGLARGCYWDTLLEITLNITGFTTLPQEEFA